MFCHVKCDRLVDADFCRYFLQYPVAIGDVWYGQYEIRSGNFAFVLVDDAFGNAAQFDLEGRAGFLSLFDDPQIPIERALDHLPCQSLDISMSHSRKAGKNEHIPNFAVTVKCKLMVH